MAKLPPDPNEWYFLDCPEAELAACCYYEYARHSPAITEAAQTLDDNARDFLSHRANANFVAVMVADFPVKPWLSLGAKERTRLVKRFGETAARWDLVVERPRTVINLPLPFPSRGRCLYEINGQTIAAIRIPWERSNKDIFAAFRRLLDEQRPTSSASPLGRKGSYQDYLNALGAERLLSYCRSTGARSAPAAAMRLITSYTNPPEGRKRDTPYSGQSPLVQAARKVAGVLRGLYHFGSEASFGTGGQYPLHYWMPELDNRPDE